MAEVPHRAEPPVLPIVVSAPAALQHQPWLPKGCPTQCENQPRDRAVATSRPRQGDKVALKTVPCAFIEARVLVGW